MQFTVNLACEYDADTDTRDLRGQLEYHDKAKKVDLHGVVLNAALFDCNNDPEPGFSTTAFGLYEPQPKQRGPGAKFFVRVVDGDESGTFGAPDHVFIFLDGGVYDGYGNAGELGGGQHHRQEIGGAEAAAARRFSRSRADGFPPTALPQPATAFRSNFPPRSGRGHPRLPEMGHLTQMSSFRPE